MNTQGSFKCQCPVGFQAVKDGPRCEGESQARVSGEVGFAPLLLGKEADLICLHPRDPFAPP